MEHDGTTPWSQPGWLKEARAWIQEKLEAQGLSLSGAIEQPHIRPWSTVLRVPTPSGDVYFKATLPRLKHEVAVTAALAEWRPDCVLPVLAVDLERGWMLQPDGGTTLRELVRESGDFRHWDSVLPFYARFQIEMVDHVTRLLALGEPDRRLEALPSQYEVLLEDKEMLRIDRENGISSAEYGRLRALAPRVAHMCEELASYRVPETLNHGDFHDANIFVQDGRQLFFDWGDSAISHPFYSLRTTFVSLYYSLQIDEGAPEHDHLRDVYLAAWEGYEPPHRLRAAFKLAQRLAAVNGALGWYNVLSRLHEAAKEEYAVPVPALLREFLEMGNEG